MNVEGLRRILLVDDSPMIHNLLRKILEKHGYTVCGDAMNGQEAVEMYGETKPELMFLDITMPVMDGMQAARIIKDGYPDAKIIMLSAMGDEEIIAEATAIGVDIFLKKPFDEYKIISAIAKVI